MQKPWLHGLSNIAGRDQYGYSAYTGTACTLFCIQLEFKTFKTSLACTITNEHAVVNSREV